MIFLFVHALLRTRLYFDSIIIGAMKIVAHVSWKSPPFRRRQPSTVLSSIMIHGVLVCPSWFSMISARTCERVAILMRIKIPTLIDNAVISSKKTLGRQLLWHKACSVGYQMGCMVESLIKPYVMG